MAPKLGIISNMGRQSLPGLGSTTIRGLVLLGRSGHMILLLALHIDVLSASGLQLGIATVDLELLKDSRQGYV